MAAKNLKNRKNKSVIAIGGNEPMSLTGALTATGLAMAAKNLKNRKNKSVIAVGGEPITVNAAVATGLLTAVEEMYRKRKNKKSFMGGEGPVMGSPINTSSGLILGASPDANAVNWKYTPAAQNGGSFPADVSSKYTILGGKKSKQNKENKQEGGLSKLSDALNKLSKNLEKEMKQQNGGESSDGYAHTFQSDNGETFATVTAPMTILMPQSSAAQTGGKKKNNNKLVGGLSKLKDSLDKLSKNLEKESNKYQKQNGGDLLRNEDMYLVKNGTDAPIPMGRGTMAGGKKNKDKKNNQDGGEGEMPMNQQMGGKKNKDNKNKQDGGEGEMPMNQQMGGKKNKDKKLVGGLADLTKALQGLSKGIF